MDNGVPIADLDVIMQLEFLQDSGSLIEEDKIILPKNAVARFYKDRFLSSDSVS